MQKFASLHKRGTRKLLATVLITALIAGPAAVGHADTSYRVLPGDTLSGIAVRYGLTVDALAAANGLGNRTIYAGQTLTIPGGSSPAPQQPANGTYVVRTGDTLSDIAVRYGTTTDALQRANGLGSTSIFVGQVLKIVGPSAAPPAQPTAKPATAPQPNGGTYTVQSGDNLITLAARFGVTREALASANGISTSSLLYIGQVLRIPGNSPAPTQQPPPPTATVQAPGNAAPTTTPQPVTAPNNADTGKPVQYTVQPGDTMTAIAAKFSTTVEAIRKLNNMPDTNVVYVGQVLTIVKGNDQSSDTPSTTPIAEAVPPMGQFGPKWIEVTLSTQTMVAYEGNTPVYTSKVSSGVTNHPTVLGTYRVYAKYVKTRMKGGEGAEHYDIPDVPYTMYFYSGYALHGAYWHNNFGHPMSHGCVNLPDDVAQWMYNWAPLGTMVVTHQ